MAGQPTASTLGQLKASGYTSRTVKEEMRQNLTRKLRSGEKVFPGILGYERTVIPEIQNAILSQHDMLLLGLRGQAKTRLIRAMTDFLDEYTPVVAGGPLNDDPLAPVSRQARDLVAQLGDSTPIRWLHRSERYGEKLATPDVTIADLIGDVDPIKAANLRLSYDDEGVIHYGIIPRSNRGIFAINELPDLQPRIQVGLLNIMQEKDIQIRGFNVRIPLDVVIVYTANPEDYTNRGNIITPLKDRIDSQILTHYPKTVEVGIEITRQEAYTDRTAGVTVRLPHFFREIVETAAFEARKSEFVDQKSGVSARLTITAMENLVSQAERRALVNNESETTVRLADLPYLATAITGKVELVYEGEQEGPQKIATVIVGKAVNTVFKQYFSDPSRYRSGAKDNPYAEVLGWFGGGRHLDLVGEMSNAAYAKALDQVTGLRALVERTMPTADAGERAAAMEFVLEGLHQNSLLGKDDLEGNRSFTDMLGTMLSSLGRSESGGSNRPGRSER